MRRLSLPLFLAIFGLVLLTLLVAQLVAAALLVAVRPGGPQAMTMTVIAREMTGKPARLEMRMLSRPPAQAQQPAEARVAAEIATWIGVAPEDVHVTMARMQRNRYILVDTGSKDAPDLQTVLVGNFTVAVRGPDGRWRAWSPRGEGVFDTVEKRYVLLFLLGALVMLPVAWWLSRALAKPFAIFARAAEQAGQDPSAPMPVVARPLEAKRASEALAAMARRLHGHLTERTAMVGALAHDFRTPLMRLAFRIESLPPDVAEPMMADIRELDQLVVSTLAYVRGSSIVGEKVPIELVSLVEQVAEAAGGSVEVALADPEPMVVAGDPVSLKRLFANLIQNAVTYGGRATVAIGKRDGQVLVDITDEGPGLPQADLLRVFEPFYRAEPSRNRNRGGTGLGLTIAAAVARAHGGSVTLRNLEPRGLRARVRLPLMADAGGRSAASPAPDEQAALSP